MTNLDMDIKRAAEAGMSYGDWKQLHPDTKTENNKLRQEQEAAEQKAQEDFAARNKIACCPVCGVEFERGSRARKYCSPECCRKALRQRQRQNYRPKKKVASETGGDHAEKKASARVTAAKQDPQILELVCAQCGKPFLAKNRLTRYCSMKCRTSAKNHRSWLRQKAKHKGGGNL